MTGRTTSAAPPDQPQARPSPRLIGWAVLRIAGSTAALVAIYYLLPLDHASAPAAAVILIIGLAGFIALVATQARSIIRSSFPGLRPSMPLPEPSITSTPRTRASTMTRCTPWVCSDWAGTRRSCRGWVT